MCQSLLVFWAIFLLETLNILSKSVHRVFVSLPCVKSACMYVFTRRPKFIRVFQWVSKMSRTIAATFRIKNRQTGTKLNFELERSLHCLVAPAENPLHSVDTFLWTHSSFVWSAVCKTGEQLENKRASQLSQNNDTETRSIIRCKTFLFPASDWQKRTKLPSEWYEEFDTSSLDENSR